MALTNCRECKKQVDKSANKCPNCGAKDPGISQKQKNIVTVLGCLLFVYLYWAWSHTETDSPQPEQTLEELRQSAVLAPVQAKVEIQEPVKLSDRGLVSKINAELEEIENSFLKDDKELKELFKQALTSKNQSKKTVNKRGEKLTTLLTSATDALHKSSLITVPNIQDSKTRQHIKEAVEAHKSWAIAEQSKIAALVLLDADEYENYQKQAQVFAQIEGVSLHLADKTLGEI